ALRLGALLHLAWPGLNRGLSPGRRDRARPSPTPTVRPGHSTDRPGPLSQPSSRPPLSTASTGAESPQSRRARLPRPRSGCRYLSSTPLELRDVLHPIAYPYLSTHTLRKSSASLLYRLCMSATEISALLHHKFSTISLDDYMNTLQGDTMSGGVMKDLLKGII